MLKITITRGINPEVNIHFSEDKHAKIEAFVKSQKYSHFTGYQIHKIASLNEIILTISSQFSVPVNDDAQYVFYQCASNVVLVLQKGELNSLLEIDSRLEYHLVMHNVNTQLSNEIPCTGADKQLAFSKHNGDVSFSELETGSFLYGLMTRAEQKEDLLKIGFPAEDLDRQEEEEVSETLTTPVLPLGVDDTDDAA